MSGLLDWVPTETVTGAFGSSNPGALPSTHARANATRGGGGTSR